MKEAFRESNRPPQRDLCASVGLESRRFELPDDYLILSSVIEVEVGVTPRAAAAARHESRVARYAREVESQIFSDFRSCWWPGSDR